jgi:hypothetical protein
VSVRHTSRPTHIPIDPTVQDAAADTEALRRKARQVSRGGARAARQLAIVALASAITYGIGALFGTAIA